MANAEYGNNKSEQAIIRGIGGQPHKNSGRNQKKGDGTWNGFTVDVKEAKSSFTLNKRAWAKACTDAFTNNNDPMLLVVLDGSSRLAVVEFEILENLLRLE